MDFLRVENFDLVQAATRLAMYWKGRVRGCLFVAVGWLVDVGVGLVVNVALRRFFVVSYHDRKCSLGNAGYYP